MTMHGDWPKSVKTAPWATPVLIHETTGENRAMRRANRSRDDRLNRITREGINSPFRLEEKK